MLLKIVDLLDGNARFLGTIFTKMSMFDDGTQIHWAEKQITSRSVRDGDAKEGSGMLLRENPNALINFR